LKDPSEFLRVGVEPPKGYLFYGPPGTGKTLLGRAIAHHANCPFIYIAASSLENKYVGESARLVNEIFTTARKYSPTVIFIDEIDAIRKRDDHNAHVPLINALLTELDGFKDSSGIVVIGATNRIEAIDKALLRPGRLGKHLYIGTPRGKKERVDLLKHYLKKVILPKDSNDEEVLSRLLRLTAGLSPAKIKALVEEAQWIVVKNKLKTISIETLLDARNNVIYGHTNSFQSEDQNELTRVAYHEAGHAIVSSHLGKPFIQISIVARTDVAGFVESEIDENKIGQSQKELLDEIKILLAGREAAKKKYVEYFSGAESDLKRAKRLAAYMVLDLGMNEMGLPPIAQIPNSDRFSDTSHSVTPLTILPDDVRNQIESIIKSETPPAVVRKCCC